MKNDYLSNKLNYTDIEVIWNGKTYTVRKHSDNAVGVLYIENKRGLSLRKSSKTYTEVLNKLKSLERM